MYGFVFDWIQIQDLLGLGGASIDRFLIVYSCLQVSEYVQADPIVVRVGDEAQAHVGRGVVEVTDEIHGLRASFGP